MEEIIASVKDIKFDIETYIEHQVGIQPLPFPGMDSKYHFHQAKQYTLFYEKPSSRPSSRIPYFWTSLYQSLMLNAP